MSTRREFVTQIAGGAVSAASLAAAGPGGAKIGDRVRFGLIGAGGRGTEIFRAALNCPSAEVVAVADLYTRRLENAKKLAPNAAMHQEYRKLLDDKSIEAVLIAAPHHQHAPIFVAAIEAGKDIYVEKTMAFNPEHARRMKKAYTGSNRIVQVGSQATSGPAVARVRELNTPERMGTITAIHTHHYRNAPYGGWKRPIPADCDTQHLDWVAFEGDVPHHDFDPNRFINWRFYWDYSGGNVFENMVHQAIFWHKMMNLEAPQSVTMAGGNYLSPDMEVPDTYEVSMNHANLLFSWSSMFGNRYYGETTDELLGNKGTISRFEDEGVTYEPQGREDGHRPVSTPRSPGVKDQNLTQLHMNNFFECVRSRKQPNCPFELGYSSAIACRMALMSYQLGRAVKWDKEREEIV
ncbi:MAG: Gfo/Idh/MocA family oxidoreductase [Bryobacteraceae bacterium]